MATRNSMRRRLPPSLDKRLVALGKAFLTRWYRNDLTALALALRTDKAGQHSYTQHYQTYFHNLRKKTLNLLEIGVGGYEDGEVGGESLRMWKAYFRNSRIVGVDICDKTRFRQHRIDIRQFSQIDSDALLQLSKEYGGFDIIIDDGSHLNEHVIETFRIMFPLLRPDGIYAIEDTQTAYWPSWGGGIGNSTTSMEQFKRLVDGLNHAEFPLEEYRPTYLDEHIFKIVFAHNLVLIFKGSNREPSNAPDLIEKEISMARVEASTD